MSSINHWTYCIWPLTGKRTLTSFQEMGFSHGSLVGCTRLEKSSETDWQCPTKWVLRNRSRVVENFTRLEKKFSWVGQQLISIAMISQVDTNYGLIHYRKKSGFLFQNQTEQWFWKVNKCTRMMGVYYIKRYSSVGDKTHLQHIVTFNMVRSHLAVHISLIE